MRRATTPIATALVPLTVLPWASAAAPADDDLARDLSGEATADERIAGMPPVFIWHTSEDAAVKVEPILQLCERLKKLNRPCELLVYETGRHGLGLGTKSYDPAQFHPWTAACSRWLGSRGYGSGRNPTAEPRAQ